MTPSRRGTGKLGSVTINRLPQPVRKIARNKGSIGAATLQGAVQARGLTKAQVEAALARPAAAPEALPTVAELAAAQSGQRLAELVEDRIGTWAAAQHIPVSTPASGPG